MIKADSPIKTKNDDLLIGTNLLLLWARCCQSGRMKKGLLLGFMVSEVQEN